MSIADQLDGIRKRAPEIAADLAAVVVDNPAQFAMIASGAYVVTRGLARVVRPYGAPGILATSLASWGVCWWLLGEARRRGVLTFYVRDPLTGDRITVGELEERYAEDPPRHP